MKRKILTDYNVSYIADIVSIVQTQSKITLANWAIDYSEDVILRIWQKYYPCDSRPNEAITAARRWLTGEVILPYVKGKILDCHAAAREVAHNHVAFISARAIAQCASTIHSARHCMGLVMYGSLAIAYDKLGYDASKAKIDEYIKDECIRMKDALVRVSVDNEKNPIGKVISK